MVDIYSKTLKCNIKSILRKKVKYKNFFDCIDRANNIYFLCSHFIRCYILHLFNENQLLPSINYDFIRMALKALSKKTCGPLPKDEQLKTYNKLCDFYDNYFVQLMNDNYSTNNSEIILKIYHTFLIYLQKK